MNQFVRRFERNPNGRDLIVGDIHGHFSKLQLALDAVGFDTSKDRLFSVGDMVDRGQSLNPAWNGWPSPGLRPCAATMSA